MKKLYIAAPFFNIGQLTLVNSVEIMIATTPGLLFYSPRTDGVLQDMTPEQRADMAPKLFALNKKMIRECDAVLAIKDHKDSGTTWETGFAHGIGKPVFGYRHGTTAEPLNIMVLHCFDAFAEGSTELQVFLRAYANGQSIEPWAVGNSSAVY